MLAKRLSSFVALCTILMFISADCGAQQKVYKWVDEDGVVHFSETPPKGSESMDTETLTTAKPPPYVPPARPITKPPVVPESGEDGQLAQADVERPQVAKKTDITEMSIPDLDRRCAEAREKKIAPLRKAEIAKCKQQERIDLAWCDRHYADFGEGGQTISGARRPAMFIDLPECVEAEQELRRRGPRSSNR